MGFVVKACVFVYMSSLAVILCSFVMIALASIADVATLEIRSKHAEDLHGFYIIYKGSKLLMSGPQLNLVKRGTEISIRDLFYNVPVRKKAIIIAEEFDSVRKTLEALSLVNTNISFSFYDGAKDRKIMSIYKCSGMLEALRQIHGHASIKTCFPLSKMHGRYKVNAVINVAPHFSKTAQHVFVNKWHLRQSELYKAIIDVFAKSRFIESDKLVGDLLSNKKRLEGYPMFVVQIQCSPSMFDKCFDPAKGEVRFIYLLEVQVGMDSLRATSSSLPIERVRPGTARTSDARGITKFTRTLSLDAVLGVKSGRSGEVLTDDQFMITYDRLQEQITPQKMTEMQCVQYHDKMYIKWLDPSTGQIYFIDERTGNSYSKLPGSSNKEFAVEKISKPANVNCIDRSRLRKRPRTCKPNEHQHDCQCENQSFDNLWAQDALRKWSNPVFKTPAKPIREICLPYHSMGNSGYTQTLLSAQAYGMQMSLSKNDLARFRVISQVDMKFICCTLPLEDKSYSVVLVDQHAADERIRLENFLQHMIPTQSTVDSDSSLHSTRLSEPLFVPCTARELFYFIRYQANFVKWNIRYNVVDNSNEDTALEYLVSETVISACPSTTLASDVEEQSLTGITVTHVPTVAADRLMADTQLLTNVLKTRTHELEVTPTVHTMPRGLLEALHSKACRGAIMFGDALSTHHCRTLVKELSKTNFPFQCAHGRPSMMPLVSLKVPKQLGIHGKLAKRVSSRWKTSLKRVVPLT